MIEVEKQFEMNDAVREQLLPDAEFIKEVVNVDEYFDNEEFELLFADIVLRRRNGGWEFKLPKGLHEEGKQVMEEFDGEAAQAAIRRHFSLAGDRELEEGLKQAGYGRYYAGKNTRNKYRIGEVLIDVDAVDWGYEIIEIELLVEEDGVKSAVAKIDEIAKAYHLKPARRKIMEWFARNKPAVFEKLQRKGLA